jgi:hypothetical protein
MSNDEERSLAAIRGSLPRGHEQYSYDGDVNAQIIPGRDVVDLPSIIEERLASSIRAGQLDRNGIRRLSKYLRTLDAQLSQETDDDDNDDNNGNDNENDVTMNDS